MQGDKLKKYKEKVASIKKKIEKLNTHLDKTEEQATKTLEIAKNISPQQNKKNNAGISSKFIRGTPDSSSL